MLPLDQEQDLNALTIDSNLSKPLYERLGEDIKVLKRKVSSEISRGIANSFSYTDIAMNLRNISNTGYVTLIELLELKDIGYKVNHLWMMQIKQKKKVLMQLSNGCNTRFQNQTTPCITLCANKGLDKPFEVDGRKAIYPSVFGIAAEDIHCRYALLQMAKWVLDDDELQTLKERAEYYGIDKTKDFDELKSKYLENISQQ